MTELLDIEELHMPTLADIRRIGVERLSPAVSDFLEGGSGGEITLEANISDFDRIALIPRVMSGLPHPSLESSFLGFKMSAPILTAPFGADGYFHPAGQMAVARANEEAGTLSIVPEAGTHSLEDVAAAGPNAALIGQLHPMGSEENFLAIIDRYRQADYQALCLTCDCPTIGWRERNLRSTFVINNDMVGGNYPPGSEVDMERAMGQLHPHTEAVWSWEKLAGLMADCELPWIAKGILTPEDAIAAADAGASAVLVSNHGGRQLDSVYSSIEALPAIAEAVGDRIEIAIDSGIRRGSDIVKALALGADAVVIGRLAAYGLAAGGERGVATVLQLLKSEMETTLALLGRGDASSINSSAVAWR